MSRRELGNSTIRTKDIAKEIPGFLAPKDTNYCKFIDKKRQPSGCRSFNFRLLSFDFRLFNLNLFRRLADYFL